MTERRRFTEGDIIYEMAEDRSGEERITIGWLTKVDGSFVAASWGSVRRVDLYDAEGSTMDAQDDELVRSRIVDGGEIATVVADVAERCAKLRVPSTMAPRLEQMIRNVVQHRVVTVDEAQFPLLGVHVHLVPNSETVELRLMLGLTEALLVWPIDTLVATYYRVGMSWSSFQRFTGVPMTVSKVTVGT